MTSSHARLIYYRTPLPYAFILRPVLCKEEGEKITRPLGPPSPAQILFSTNQVHASYHELPTPYCTILK